MTETTPSTASRLHALEVLQLLKAEVITIPEARVMIGLPATIAVPDPDEMTVEQLRAEVKARRQSSGS